MTVTNLQEKYISKYKVVDDGTDDPVREERVWGQEIPGKYGAIYPCGYDGSLSVRIESKTKVRNNPRAKRLEAEGFAVIQRGDWEIVFKFDPAQIFYIAGVIKAKKRRHLSPEQKAQAIAALAKARKRPPKPPP
jgi:hypothetical protein